MKENTVGGYYKENYLVENSPIGGTTAREIITPNLDWMDGIGIQVVYEDYTRVITANGTTDNVVSGTKTWTFAAGNFTDGDIGGTFVVAGSVADDGTYTIASVTNATTIVSTEAVTSDETFTSSVTATLTDAPVQATITLDVSQNYQRSIEAALNQTVAGGDWTDFTSAFSPTPSAIAAAGSQFFQAYPLVARYVRITITPTAGQSNFRVLYCAKGTK